MKRQGLTLAQVTKMFSHEDDAEQWFIAQRWHGGIHCPFCKGASIHERKNRRPMPYLCRTCRKSFSVKTKTIMQSSNLPLTTWALAFYLYSTNLKGVSSTKLHRDLGITQKSAWHLAHRIRETWNNGPGHLDGPVEVDETYIGGLERNKHTSKKLKAGRGSVGKQPVLGVKSRTTNMVQATVLSTVSATTLQRSVRAFVTPGSMVYSDQNTGYPGIMKQGYHHQAVNHSAKQYVR